jgi:hypothetical protein
MPLEASAASGGARTWLREAATSSLFDRQHLRERVGARDQAAQLRAEDLANLGAGHRVRIGRVGEREVDEAASPWTAGDLR